MPAVAAYVAAGMYGWAAVAAVELYGTYILLAAAYVYGKQQQRKREQEARDSYNASLQDRMATVVSTEAPHVYVYGRCRVGSAIVVIFTSGSRDEYKHLVCVHAAHECDAIEEIYVANKPLGTLDGNGDVTAGDYFISSTSSIINESHTGSSFTLAHVPVPSSLRIIELSDSPSVAVGYQTLSGANVTMAVSGNYLCHYEYATGTSRVRAQIHLGEPGEAADATLIADIAGGKWTAASKLSGYCYTVIRLDLNQPEFQGGVPPIEVLVRGKKLYDPRDESTIWNQNPALALRDYLTSPICGVDAADIPDAYVITAANVCDESLIKVDPRYTLNGTVNADQDQKQVIESMVQAMAGTMPSTTWEMSAGKYVAPVMALDTDDRTTLVGNIAITPGVSDADLYNGVKGRYIAADTDAATGIPWVMTDFEPYQNATYRAADGRDLYASIDFPFTNEKQRVHNLCRIFTEDQRNGYTVTGEFSLKAWTLKLGERETLSNSVFGLNADVFRVMDKKFKPAGMVNLVLKEDAATIWDEADSVAVDDTPNTGLPDPFVIGLCSNIVVTESLYQTTGSAGVKSKATVSWDPPAGSGLEFELEYKPYISGEWIEVFTGRATSVDLSDLKPQRYDFRVKARNSLATGEYTSIYSPTLYGLLALPGDIANFSVLAMNGVALAQWDLTADLDVKIGGRVIIRFSPLTNGAIFGNGTIIAELNGDAVAALLPLATGTYMAKFRDSSGNYSETEATFVATEALVTGWTTVTTSTQHSSFSGTKTRCEVSGSNLIMSGAYLDANYAYAATIDCGSIAVRRYHSHIKANAYLATDLIDARGNVDTWTSVDGSTEVNGCDAWQEIRVSDDNSTWSAWQPFTVGDFSGRYAQVRLQMTRDSDVYNIEISELSTAAKIPA